MPSWITRRKAYVLLYFLINAVILLYMLIIYSNYLHRSFLDNKCPKRKTNEFKRILFTTHWWQSHFPFVKEANKFCPRCVFTENQTMWNSSDAVIFHGRMLQNSVPIFRPRGQIWVLMAFESMAAGANFVAFKKAQRFNGKFNWTMTYRRDSDIYAPVGRFISIDDMPRPGITDKWAFIPGVLGHNLLVLAPSVEDISKRKMIAWISSKCESSSKRELIVKEISKYVEVDVYGKCGTLKCDVPRHKTSTGVDCRVQISKEYKFYLAFENSICEDYVTEKFFETISVTEMVPIVYGGADYAKMFPEKSFINVGDFNSVKELADYLIFLNSNVMEYLKYFEWRHSYWVQTNRFVTGYCDLCQKLWHTSEFDCADEPHTYKSVYHWWYNKNYFSNDQSICSFPEDKFQKLFSTLT